MILSEMKKFLGFISICAMCMMFGGGADAAARDANASKTSRASMPATRKVSPASNDNVARNVNVRGTSTRPTPTTVGARNTAPTTSRATTVSRATAGSLVPRTVSGISARAANNRGVRAVTNTNAAVTARAASEDATTIAATVSGASKKSGGDGAVVETRTGAEYEKCKTAYFTCMDQFCKLKNDEYRRCSCSDRVYDLDEVRDTLADAGQQITEFNEDLEAVGLTAAQATAMRTASEGENALMDDESASKALLQAIMNSIRGEDSNVGGKYSGLNSVNLAFDTTNAFGMQDAGQVIATYNGANLYSAVYPQCRSAVKADCNNASLQRAINAYLMAVEQDCNTVQTAMDNQRKKIKSAIRESSAMLDLARVENRKKHNTSDITTCINEVESAILSEEVCGAGYHKCLDNGEFIDVATGKPIAGVIHFYELEKLLAFDTGLDAADQKLAKNSANRTFVTNFESRVKQFAEPALDKCVEDAEFVWSEYLDKAMLDIYYAQRAKVAEIKQGCFDFVSSCYMNGDKSLTAAMQALASDSLILLQPDKLTLTHDLCTDYIASCDNMFSGNIIEDYIDNQQDVDTLSSCRAVAHQCFKNFGGTNYENFYYPYSGAFDAGMALNWFTLYEYVKDGNNIVTRLGDDVPVSECAKQLYSLPSCRPIIGTVFGGFDSHVGDMSGDFDSIGGKMQYGTRYTEYKINEDDKTYTKTGGNFASREPRPVGVATEVYNQILDILDTQCENIQGKFVKYKDINTTMYNPDNFCYSQFKYNPTYWSKTSSADTDGYHAENPAPSSIIGMYGIADGENMCPRSYAQDVDTQSWGACLCWENGARRSKNGLSAKCMPILPTISMYNDSVCSVTDKRTGVFAKDASDPNAVYSWCTSKNITDNGIVCLPNHQFQTSDGKSYGCKNGAVDIIGLPSKQ